MYADYAGARPEDRDEGAIQIGKQAAELLMEQVGAKKRP
jgi:hypothetical protein